jgi:hypothetical protein
MKKLLAALFALMIFASLGLAQTGSDFPTIDVKYDGVKSSSTTGTFTFNVIAPISCLVSKQSLDLGSFVATTKPYTSLTGDNSVNWTITSDPAYSFLVLITSETKKIGEGENEITCAWTMGADAIATGSNVTVAAGAATHVINCTVTSVTAQKYDISNAVVFAQTVKVGYTF